MGMSGGGGSGDFNSEINVTPMVDIMLVLLIIFMVVTPMLQHGVTVNLPKDLNNPEEDPRIVKDTSVVISIPEDGKYYIGKDEIRKDLLKDKVQKMLDAIKKEEDKVVYIKSGTGVSYGDVVTVINEVRALGVDKIGLVADKKKGGGGAGAPAAPAPATQGA
ncbi:MAG TPA: biopolymer transporter ExbD [Pyrinomonadaceae bacterium]|nr:biopolymer transporter ExbD [Pyrinomonadaceae bacterium]